MTFGERALFFIILIISASFQAYGLYLGDYRGLFFIIVLPFIWIHICGLMVVKNEIHHYLTFYKFTILLLGPFASGGCLLLIFFSGKRKLLKEYRKFVAANVIFSSSERLELGLTRNYLDGGVNTITPYVDIMDSDNVPMKRSTINKVIQHPGPYSRTILDLGLTDKDQDIRFYAASGLIMLNDGFIKEFHDCLIKIESDPANAQLRTNLATAYDQYYSWGLPEKEEFDNYYRKMRSAYEKAYKLAPDNFNAIMGFSRALIRNEELDEASRILNHGLRLFPSSINLFIAHLSILFSKREFKRMKRKINEIIKSSPNITLDIFEAFSYWNDSEVNTTSLDGHSIS